ncbi:unnamed protein product [Urochloa decumbens]|uniref:Ribulose bisphosphate carboxylase/oxygenase activase, chloroplastic n=1 Tax=Urochloa decumbens TaxID=240449 RepID=A0ABC9EKV5_9POAL
MAAVFSIAAPQASTPSSFLGKKLIVRKQRQQQQVKQSCGRVMAASGAKTKEEEVDESKQTEQDRWKGLAYDTSDDQQDITRGKGLVDYLFQAPMGDGTHEAVLSSYEYISQGLRQYSLDNTMDGYYIAPAFMDKLVVHIAKNFMPLPNIKVPLILGIWGGKGQGKSFQCELVFAKMGINPIVMSAGELESGSAGEPAKLIRQRYREAADIVRKGKMCVLFINDLDAGAGRMGGTTQYTVNNQMVNATLMNIADNPTNVQLPGMYNRACPSLSQATTSPRCTRRSSATAGWTSSTGRPPGRTALESARASSARTTSLTRPSSSWSTPSQASPSTSSARCAPGCTTTRCGGGWPRPASRTSPGSSSTQGRARRRLSSPR